MNITRETRIVAQVSPKEIIKGLKALYPNDLNIQAMDPLGVELTFGSSTVPAMGCVTIRFSKNTTVPSPADPAEHDPA